MSKTLQTILYVDDEEDIRLVVEIALQDIGGYQVKLCESGIVALEILKTFQPDMILLDVMMPNMDGLTTLQKLREQPHLATVPVVFMTAKAQPQEIQAFKKMGAIDVVTKPFDPMTLAEHINTIWQQYCG